MNKEQEFFSALYDLRANYLVSDVTWSECSTGGCKQSAKGGGYCALCCEKEIAMITGDPTLARELHLATATAHRRICKALDLINGE